jgi:hypothetical protein
MSTEGLRAPSTPNWGVVRAVLLIVAGAVVCIVALATVGSAGPQRSAVLGALGAAVLLLGVGRLLGMARADVSERPLRLSRVTLLAGGCFGVVGGVAEMMGGGVPLGLATAAGGVAIGALGVLVPRMRSTGDEDE